ncbi:unnamed protein product [Schistosoma haematobium]|nr:unnamed protein product [Schistosoma haematobium]CAH8681564.1 unnamed protein product [Schistosoma haematobium]
MTRIQILKYAADKLIGIPLTSTSTTEYKSDPLYLITAKPYEQNKFLVHNDSITDKVKFTKASIEQYRRRLERIEYDRIHSFLGGEKNYIELIIICDVMKTKQKLFYTLENLF